MPVFAASIGTRIWDHVRFANYTPKMRWRGVQAYDLFDKCGVSCGSNGAGVVLQIQSPYWWNLTGSRLAVCLNESFTILLPRASQCAIAATLIHDTLLQRTTLGSERRNDSHEISSGKAAVRVDIIVVYVQRYRFGHETHFVPPITGIHLAAITPHDHQVRVIHQQVERIDFDTSADLIALSFFSGFAPEAYRLAQEFKKRGKRIVAGGPHATFAPDEVLRYCDSVVIGEAESVWTELLADAAGGRLRDRYVGKALPLIGIPTPRYDLLPRSFFIQRVVQATRGCPFTCSFCTVPTLNPGFRTRPVAEVIEDVKYDKFRHWWQRKVVWFWDDNLTINRPYIRTLLGAMIPLRKWWLTQASMDIAEDASLLDLMKWSGCIGIFFGIESFGVQSLKDAHKPQNMVDKYQARIRALHDRGICVMAGFIAGFDSDTPESVVAMAKQLYDTGVDVPFLSVLTPYRGTPAYTKMASEGRILIGRGWEFYNGYNVSFNPKNMSPDQLLQAHRALWREAFSFKYSLLRIVRSFFRLRLGAFLMCAMMNGFYCLKRMRGNEPMTFGESSPCAQFTGLTSDAA